MKQIPLFLLSIVLLFSGCRGGQQTTDEPAAGSDKSVSYPSVQPAEAGQDTLALPDAHTSRNSLDWAGIYTGVTPCADCPGIDTELRIEDSLTYRLSTTYLERSDSAFVRSGSFRWNEQGNTVILENMEDRPNRYFVGENYLVQLDLSGNRITGALAEQYVLTKEAQ